MQRHLAALAIALGLCAVNLPGCGNRHPAPAAGTAASESADSRTVNLFIWADYLAPDTIAGFEAATGIRVHVSFFESPETLESRMLTGHSGFDVAVPTAAFLGRQIRSGAYLPLDKSRLPNYANQDPAMLSRLVQRDPGNEHAVVYSWGTSGLAYNTKLVTKAVPDAPLGSWRMLFDPSIAARLAPCGINMIDDPVGVVDVALRYLGRNRDAVTARDLADVETLLVRIRPYIRNIDTNGEIEALANGDICLTLGYNGDAIQARKRAAESKNGVQIAYVIPGEGSTLWIDTLAIPRDAPHPENAYLLINYLLDPRVMAHISNAIGFANGNAASTPLLDPAVRNDPAIYPTADSRRRLLPPWEPTPEQSRTITRLWQKFKTGQ